MKKSQNRTRKKMKSQKKNQHFFQKGSTSETRRIERTKDTFPQEETKQRNRMKGQRAKNQRST